MDQSKLDLIAEYNDKSKANETRLQRLEGENYDLKEAYREKMRKCAAWEKVYYSVLYICAVLCAYIY